MKYLLCVDGGILEIADDHSVEIEDGMAVIRDRGGKELASYKCSELVAITERPPMRQLFEQVSEDMKAGSTE